MHDHGPPGGGTRTRRSTDWTFAGRCQGLRATGSDRRAKQRTEAGWLTEYIGYMQDHGSTWTVQVMLGEGGRKLIEERTAQRSTTGWYLLHLILVCVLVAEIRNVRHGADLPLLHDL